GQFHEVLQVVDEIFDEEVVTGRPCLVNAMTDIIDSGVELISEFTHCGSVLPRAASTGDEPGNLPTGSAVGAVHHKHSCRALRELYVCSVHADKLVTRITASSAHSILPTASIQCTMLGTHLGRGEYAPLQHPLRTESEEAIWQQTTTHLASKTMRSKAIRSSSSRPSVPRLRQARSTKTRLQ